MAFELKELTLELDKWLSIDGSNLGLYFSIAGGVMVVSAVTMVVFRRLIGKGSDERTEKLDLRISYATLLVGFVAMLTYVDAISRGVNHIRELVLVPLAITLCAGMLATMYYYWRSR